ncbi:MAG: hypothetical protein ACERKX_11790 [Anaerolineales bacterium]
MADSNRFSWIMWPFDALWWLVTTILALTGRLIMVLLGAVLMLGGVLISMTIVGAVIGIPLLFFGVLVVLRGLFRSCPTHKDWIDSFSL